MYFVIPVSCHIACITHIAITAFQCYLTNTKNFFHWKLCQYCLGCWGHQSLIRLIKFTQRKVNESAGLANHCTASFQAFPAPSPQPALTSALLRAECVKSRNKMKLWRAVKTLAVDHVCRIKNEALIHWSFSRTRIAMVLTPAKASLQALLIKFGGRRKPYRPRSCSSKVNEYVMPWS